MPIYTTSPIRSVPAEAFSVHWGARRIPPSRGRHMTGRYPLGAGRGGVPFESRLECLTLSWLAGFPALQTIEAQPVTIRGPIAGRIRAYTPDFLVTFAEVSAPLAALGFGLRTIVEVKPSAYRWDPLVEAKLGATRTAIGLPVVLITELNLNLSHTPHGARQT